MQIHRLRARTDNYVWLLHDPERRTAIAVDPSEAEPVLAALATLGAQLEAVWCTHHHHDHVGGNPLLADRFPGLRIYGGREDVGRIPGLTDPVGEGDTVHGPLGDAGPPARVWFIPGHTRGHVAYLWRDRAFVGDTLFGGGCGRLFEGTAAQMFAALARLRTLPDDTFVHAGHEYTWHNVRWAVAAGLEPENAALTARHAALAADPAQLTMPTRLGEEKASNPFLRWDTPALIARVGTSDPVGVFAALRAEKDAWRG
jgi:hydroxyacylglutathione hydrolase